MRSQKIISDITTLIRARNPLIWIVSKEEMRVERGIVSAVGAIKPPYDVQFWDCAAGLQDPTGRTIDDAMSDPARMISAISQGASRAVYVLRDMHKWLDPVTLRAMRNMCRALASAPAKTARTVIVVSPEGKIPPELEGHAVVLEYPLPDREEMATILDTCVARLPDDIRPTALVDGSRDAAIDAVVGLTADEAQSCYARSLVESRVIDVAKVTQEKKTVIAREKVLTWYEPDPRGLDAIGGLDLLKPWAAKRYRHFSAEARSFGLRAPKGVFVVGVPGCGKSLFAKALAAAWRQPLLRLDLGALKSKWVGESEANIRKALSVAETVSPCIVWLDEIEKALGGATDGSADGGVSTDALGAILTWMQEKTAPVFVIATANDVSKLPPELMRKGRFDDVFFVNLPTASERREILKISLTATGRDVSAFDFEPAVKATDGFSGAECEALCQSALDLAFGDRDVSPQDFVEAARAAVPLSKTTPEKIAALREWAKTRARPASSPDGTSHDGVAGALDL